MSAPTENQPSTLKAAIDTVTGGIQSAVGMVTGNTGDKVAAENKKQEAREEYDASQAAIKAGPLTASTAGIATDNSNRTAGSWNQTAGAAKEALGGMIGNDALKAAGQQQHREGQQQEAEGQIRDYGRGLSDRVQGTVGSAISGLTNDREAREKYDQMHDDGKTRQRSVETDLQKEAESRKRAEQTQDPFN